jgi:hypothetical protein
MVIIGVFQTSDENSIFSTRTTKNYNNIIFLVNSFNS